MLRASPEHEVFQIKDEDHCQSHLRPSLGIHGLGYSDFVEIDAAARRIVDYLLSFLNLATKDTEWLSNQSVALATITFVNIWCGYPFYMISILAGLQGISEDLYESSALDGATKWKSFWHITIPQVKPILISIAMLDFVWTLQSFAVIWMMTGGGPVNSTQTLSIYIYKLAFNSSQYGIASAVAVLLLIVCVAVAIFYVKQQKKARE